MFIDTHTHIYLDQFAEDRENMIQRALDAQVGKMFMPNIDTTSIDAMRALSRLYPSICYPQYGLHPCSVKDDYKSVLNGIKKCFDNEDASAVGEIGIDLYWDKTYYEEQKAAFELQIEWARDMGLPFVIHSRDALDINIEIVTKLQDGSLTGVFHCFNGTVRQYKQIKDIGFFVGLGGVITYKNSGMSEVVEQIDLNDIVLETDAPYLSPVPKRGKRNEPAYIPFVAEKISEIKHISISEIGKQTTQNALRLYQLDS